MKCEVGDICSVTFWTWRSFQLKDELQPALSALETKQKSGKCKEQALIQSFTLCYAVTDILQRSLCCPCTTSLGCMRTLSWLAWQTASSRQDDLQ